MKRTKEYYMAKVMELSVSEAIGDTVNFAEKAYDAVKGYAYAEKEHFIVLHLDGSHKIIDTEVVSVGILNKTVVHPREVFRSAIMKCAAAIIIAHNHPSGKLEPSVEDENITRRLKEVGEIVGIQVLDHIIATRSGYYSFNEKGKL
jgi:DNA repair protein RadC